MRMGDKKQKGKGKEESPFSLEIQFSLWAYMEIITPGYLVSLGKWLEACHPFYIFLLKTGDQWVLNAGKSRQAHLRHGLEDHLVGGKPPDVTGEFIIRSVTEKENFLNSFPTTFLRFLQAHGWLHPDVEHLRAYPLPLCSKWRILSCGVFISLSRYSLLIKSSISILV